MLRASDLIDKLAIMAVTNCTLHMLIDSDKSKRYLAAPAGAQKKFAEVGQDSLVAKLSSTFITYSVHC